MQNADLHRYLFKNSMDRGSAESNKNNLHALCRVISYSERNITFVLRIQTSIGTFYGSKAKSELPHVQEC